MPHEYTNGAVGEFRHPPSCRLGACGRVPEDWGDESPTTNLLRRSPHLARAVTYALRFTLVSTSLPSRRLPVECAFSPDGLFEAWFRVKNTPNLREGEQLRQLLTAGRSGLGAMRTRAIRPLALNQSDPRRPSRAAWTRASNNRCIVGSVGASASGCHWTPMAKG